MRKSRRTAFKSLIESMARVENLPDFSSARLRSEHASPKSVGLVPGPRELSLLAALLLRIDRVICWFWLGVWIVDPQGLFRFEVWRIVLIAQ